MNTSIDEISLKTSFKWRDNLFFTEKILLHYRCRLDSPFVVRRAPLKELNSPNKINAKMIFKKKGIFV
jgi:hypothetical protein